MEQNEEVTLESLSENATTNIEEPVVVAPSIDARAGIPDPLQAALDRDAAAKQAELDAKAAAEAEKKNDGRTYELEFEGINLGDSLVRRLSLIDENANTIKEVIQEEALQEELGETDDIEEASLFAEETSDLDEDELDMEEDINSDPIFKTPEPIKEAPKMEQVVEEVVEQAIVEEKEIAEVIKKEVKEEKSDFDSTNLPSQSDMIIDAEDLEEIEDMDDMDDAEDDDTLSDAELDDLRNSIKTKLSVVAKTNGGKVVEKESVSIASALNIISAAIIDWPLMSAGRLVSMKAFTGSEIEQLNRGSAGRNRFNTMKDIYRSIYDHITSEKPDFEGWLRITSFMDIEHLYMAIYRACFKNANYVPYTCVDPECGNVFLSENIDIIDMCRFKNDESKKRFMSILESDVTASKVDSKLFPTAIIPISDRIAVGFREPSIYNTIFENSILDEAFVGKYTSLLTMMVYIDEIYIIDDNGDYVKIALKKDKTSIAKTAKYRIINYAKIINSLPSDSYQKIISIISQINDMGDEVQYALPEYSCTKCGKTVDDDQTKVVPAQTLLFSRHQLNLLSQA